MNLWIAIVDMDQPDVRNIVVISEDEFACAEFASLEEIQELRNKHSLGVFEWWAFNVDTGEAEVLYA